LKPEVMLLLVENSLLLEAMQMAVKMTFALQALAFQLRQS
jgi:hypothetical protein